MSPLHGGKRHHGGERHQGWVSPRGERHHGGSVTMGRASRDLTTTLSYHIRLGRSITPTESSSKAITAERRSVITAKLQCAIASTHCSGRRHTERASPDVSDRTGRIKAATARQGRANLPKKYLTWRDVRHTRHTRHNSSTTLSADAPCRDELNANKYTEHVTRCLPNFSMCVTVIQRRIQGFQKEEPRDNVPRCVP